MNDFGSSTSPRPSEENEDVSSNRETSLLNQTSSYALNNFKAAYKAVQQQQSKTIVRGRKTFAFWTLVVLLLMLAVGNLILTITILGVLRIGSGMESIELIPQDQTLKFFGNADLGTVYKQDGVIENFLNENLDVTAENSSVLANLYTRPNRELSKMAMEQNHTYFKFSSFRIQTPKKELLFDAVNPTYLNLKNANNFKSKSIETNKVRSKLDETLKIEGDKIHLKGNEGSKVEAREIVWSADQDIYLKSINGSIVLSGKEGTYVDVERLPLARLAKTSYVTAQFKICVCMPRGKLFRLPIANVNDPVYCHQADMSADFNPCL